MIYFLRDLTFAKVKKNSAPPARKFLLYSFSSYHLYYYTLTKLYNYLVYNYLTTFLK